jgi:hypothetical protein
MAVPSATIGIRISQGALTMHDRARTDRPRSTRLAMDVVRPSQAFGAPPAPAMQDAWHWIRRAFFTLRAAGAALLRRAGGDGRHASADDDHPAAGVRP